MTTISTTDLGVTVCRALMREMDDKPIRLEIANARTLDRDYERTSARKVADQWTVTLAPMLDFVTVAANGKYWGFASWDQIDIGGVNRIGPEYDYVTYPDGFKEDPSLITGEEYVAKLRAVVERALKAAEDDYASAVAKRKNATATAGETGQATAGTETAR